MKPSDRHKVIEELEWHVEDPRRAFDVLTPEEVRDVIKRGFITKELSDDIQKRLEVT